MRLERTKLREGGHTMEVDNVPCPNCGKTIIEHASGDREVLARRCVDYPFCGFWEWAPAHYAGKGVGTAYLPGLAPETTEKA